MSENEITLAKRSMNPSDPPLTWSKVNENWRIIEEAFNNLIKLSQCKLYPMDGVHLEISHNTSQYPTIIAIDEDGLPSIVDYQYEENKVIITTIINFKGIIILKN